MHAGPLNFHFHKSYWPFSVWPGSHEACPTQTGKNRFNKSAQWGSKHEASNLQWSLIFPERLAWCTLWISKNTLPCPAKYCIGVSFSLIFVCVSSGEEHCLRTTTIKLASFCSHLYLNPSYVTLLYRFCLSDLFTFTLPLQALVNSAGLECQWCQASTGGWETLIFRVKGGMGFVYV